MIWKALVTVLLIGALSACSPAISAQSVAADETVLPGHHPVDHSGAVRTPSADNAQAAETRTTRSLRFSWRSIWIWVAFFPLWFV